MVVIPKHCLQLNNIVGCSGLHYSCDICYSPQLTQEEWQLVVPLQYRSRSTLVGNSSRQERLSDIYLFESFARNPILHGSA